MFELSVLYVPFLMEMGYSNCTMRIVLQLYWSIPVKLMFKKKKQFNFYLARYLITCMYFTWNKIDFLCKSSISIQYIN